MTGPTPKPTRSPLSLSYQTHRIVIGLLGLLLPLLLPALSDLFVTPKLPTTGVLDSVSAYYYSGAMFAFVGILFALALFLGTYRGYAGAIDQVLGILGGLAALGVVIFPTEAPDDSLKRAWWTPCMKDLHYGSATALFLIFIIFAVFVFTQSDQRWAAMRPNKKVRNVLSVLCGVFMFFGVIWTWRNGHAKRPIFVPECFTIGFFAVSWLLKATAPWFELRERASAG